MTEAQTPAMQQQGAWQPVQQGQLGAQYAGLLDTAAEQAAETQQPVEPNGVSYADQLRQDTQAAEPPGGAVLLRDPLDLTWDERADVLAAIDDLAPAFAKLTEQGDEHEVQLSEVFEKPSDAIRMIAKMVRVLTPLAHSADEFTEWTKRASQQDISNLYGYVQQHMGLGES